MASSSWDLGLSDLNDSIPFLSKSQIEKIGPPVSLTSSVREIPKKENFQTPQKENILPQDEETGMKDGNFQKFSPEKSEIFTGDVVTPEKAKLPLIEQNLKGNKKSKLVLSSPFTTLPNRNKLFPLSQNENVKKKKFQTNGYSVRAPKISTHINVVEYLEKNRKMKEENFDDFGTLGERVNEKREKKKFVPKTLYECNVPKSVEKEGEQESRNESQKERIHKIVFKKSAKNFPKMEKDGKLEKPETVDEKIENKPDVKKDSVKDKKKKRGRKKKIKKRSRDISSNSSLKLSPPNKTQIRIKNRKKTPQNGNKSMKRKKIIPNKRKIVINKKPKTRKMNNSILNTPKVRKPPKKPTNFSPLDKKRINDLFLKKRNRRKEKNQNDFNVLHVRLDDLLKESEKELQKANNELSKMFNRKTRRKKNISEKQLEKLMERYFENFKRKFGKLHENAKKNLRKLSKFDEILISKKISELSTKFGQIQKESLSNFREFIDHQHLTKTKNKIFPPKGAGGEKKIGYVTVSNDTRYSLPNWNEKSNLKDDIEFMSNEKKVYYENLIGKFDYNEIRKNLSSNLKKIKQISHSKIRTNRNENQDEEEQEVRNEDEDFEKNFQKNLKEQSKSVEKSGGEKKILSAIEKNNGKLFSVKNSAGILSDIKNLEYDKLCDKYPSLSEKIFKFSKIGHFFHEKKKKRQRETKEKEKDEEEEKKEREIIEKRNREISMNQNSKNIVTEISNEKKKIEININDGGIKELEKKRDEKKGGDESVVTSVRELSKRVLTTSKIFSVGKIFPLNDKVKVKDGNDVVDEKSEITHGREENDKSEEKQVKKVEEEIEVVMVKHEGSREEERVEKNFQKNIVKKILHQQTNDNKLVLMRQEEKKRKEEERERTNETPKMILYKNEEKIRDFETHSKEEEKVERGVTESKVDFGDRYFKNEYEKQVERKISKVVDQIKDEILKEILVGQIQSKSIDLEKILESSMSKNDGKKIFGKYESIRGLLYSPSFIQFCINNSIDFSDDVIGEILKELISECISKSTSETVETVKEKMGKGVEMNLERNVVKEIEIKNVEELRGKREKRTREEIEREILMSTLLLVKNDLVDEKLIEERRKKVEEERTERFKKGKIEDHVPFEERKLREERETLNESIHEFVGKDEKIVNKKDILKTGKSGGKIMEISRISNREKDSIKINQNIYRKTNVDMTSHTTSPSTSPKHTQKTFREDQRSLRDVKKMRDGKTVENGHEEREENEITTVTTKTTTVEEEKEHKLPPSSHGRVEGKEITEINRVIKDTLKVEKIDPQELLRVMTKKVKKTEMSVQTDNLRPKIERLTQTTDKVLKTFYVQTSPEKKPIKIEKVIQTKKKKVSEIPVQTSFKKEEKDVQTNEDEFPAEHDRYKKDVPLFETAKSTEVEKRLKKALANIDKDIVLEDSMEISDDEDDEEMKALKDLYPETGIEDFGDVSISDFPNIIGEVMNFDSSKIEIPPESEEEEEVK